MTSILKRIGLRARKLLILLICLPLLAGVVAAYLESKTPPSFTGQATVRLGNYEDELKPQAGNATDAETLIKSEKYLKKIQDNTNKELNFNNIKSRLVITSKGTNFLVFQYTGSDRNEVNTSLNALMDGFTKSSLKNYNRNKRMLNDLIAEADKASELDPNKPHIKLEMQNYLNHLVKTEVVDPVTVTGSYNNPVKRGIFGVILGLMLDIAILIIPEIFREYR